MARITKPITNQPKTEAGRATRETGKLEDQADYCHQNGDHECIEPWVH